MKVSEGIGREVTEHASGPVNILQNTLTVIFYLISYYLSAQGVPELRKLRHAPSLLKDCLFHAVTENDVEVVRHLIGIHPDG